MDIQRGQMTLANGETVDVELEVSADVLRMVADGSSVGAWPIRYCRVTPRGNGLFDLSIDGEAVLFDPADGGAFAELAARRFVSSSLADRIATVKTLPAELPPEQPSPVTEDSETPAPAVDTRKMLVGAGIAAFLVAASYGLLVLRDRPRPDIPQVTVPPTAATAAPVTPWFELTPAEFAERWNLTAADLGISAVLPTAGVENGFDQTISDWIYVQGTVTDDGTLNTVVVSVDPSGPASSDRSAIAIWGLTIAAVDPAAGSSERRAILEALGVDPANPQLDPEETAVDWGGNHFSIRFVPGFSTVLFRVQPVN